MNLVERLRDERYITTADWILKEVREAADRIEALEEGLQYFIDWDHDVDDVALKALNKGKDQ